MSVDNALDIVVGLNKLIGNTDVYQVVKWETETGYQYQLLDINGDEIDLIEMEKEDELD